MCWGVDIAQNFVEAGNKRAKKEGLTNYNGCAIAPLPFNQQRAAR